MLYLFGRLALSDALDYHENFLDDDFRPTTSSERPTGPEADVCAAAPDLRLRRSSHTPQADSACPGRLGN